MRGPLRIRALLGGLLVVIAVEFALAVIGVVMAPRAHGSTLQPAEVDAAFSQPSTGAGIAAVLNPGVPVVANARPAVSSPSSSSTSPPPAATKAPAPGPTTTVPRPAPPQVAATRLGTGAMVAATQTGWGCAAAIAWLDAHSAPGYRFVCPGYAYGHQAMTCNNTSYCPGYKVIVIAEPCPAAYMNEAHNSWIISGLASGVLDPFGYCR